MYDMRVALGTTAVPQGQPFQGLVAATSDSAVIYVYRNVGWAEVPDVVLNGVTAQSLAEGGFIVQSVAPGPLTITVQKNPSRDWTFKPIGVSVVAGKGERRFFRIGAGMGGVVIVTPVVGTYSYETSIQEVPESIAVQELSKLKAMR
jgi:hypothetical protein